MEEHSILSVNERKENLAVFEKTDTDTADLKLPESLFFKFPVRKGSFHYAARTIFQENGIEKAEPSAGEKIAMDIQNRRITGLSLCQEKR